LVVDRLGVAHVQGTRVQGCAHRRSRARRAVERPDPIDRGKDSGIIGQPRNPRARLALSQRSGGQTMTRSRARVVAPVVAVALVAAAPASAQSTSASPSGQLTWAAHVALAPTWFDPAETPGIITPFMILYALHDALVKPMPGNAMAPCLAESW